MKKKVWEKPKLVVLVRGRPEEAVLLGCKGPGFEPTPANQFYPAECIFELARDCEDCNTLTTT